MDINIKIVGVVPLLCNRFTEEAALAATAGSRTAAPAAEKGTPFEQSEKKLYRSLDQQSFVIPQPNLLRCLVDGGRYHKIGRKQITTAQESLLYAALDIAGTEIKIEHKEPWRVDTRPVVNPSTRGRILCHRPMFDDWLLSFTAHVDTTLIGPKLLRLIVDDAGRRVGLGDFRPARKGPFGRFRVDYWQEISEGVDEPLVLAA
jgi:hypothetical protein